MLISLLLNFPSSRRTFESAMSNNDGDGIDGA